MSDKIHYTIQIWISDIVVDNKYYSFKYHVAIDGRAHKTAEYSDKHARQDDISDFKRALEDGYALEVACQRLDISY